MGKNTRSMDDYLAGVTDEQRAVLERIRKAIHAVAPGAEECISYGLPAFRLEGRPLVAFGATARHCAFYPMSGQTVAAFADELEAFDTSKGTIRFQPTKPIPVSLVKAMVKSRMIEISDNANTPKKAAPKARSPKAAKSAPAELEGHAAIVDWIERWPWKKGSSGGVNEEMRPIVRRLDELIAETIPGLEYAIKWRVPFYGLPERGWIISIGALTAHVTVSFFGGADFDPPPPHDPGTPSVPRVRYVKVHTLEEAEGALMRSWIKQAGRLPGWIMKDKGRSP